MPIPFDRFRLLNGSRFRNESTKAVYARASEEDPPIEIPPGAEADLPVSPEGETILEVPSEPAP
jgi:hypothetical protein